MARTVPVGCALSGLMLPECITDNISEWILLFCDDSVKPKKRRQILIDSSEKLLLCFSEMSNVVLHQYLRKNYPKRHQYIKILKCIANEKVSTKAKRRLLVQHSKDVRKIFAPIVAVVKKAQQHKNGAAEGTAHETPARA